MFTLHKESFPQRELRILELWEKQKIFQKSIEQRENEKTFSFYDGPPFATGLPHYGHLVANTLKDVVPRYKTMKGYCVRRRFGWDCHGLPVENEIEKEKQLFGAKAIEEYGIKNFNEACANIVLRYTKEWKKTIDRVGRWVDFSHTYRTMDKTFMESVWWVFSEIFKKGLVYEGYKVMPFSAQLGTPLSNFEANLNYKDVNDPSLTILFSLKEEENTFFVVWTTTPWTLVSNLAVAVGKDIEYVKIFAREHKKNMIMAKERLPSYFSDENEYEILQTFTGEDLKGKRYEPLFDYFKDHENAFQVLLGDFVSLEEGTGIVHMAPAFGEDDFYACQKAEIAPVCPVDENGKFTYEIAPYEGLFVKDADKQIIRLLKEQKRVFRHTQINHRYPYCWRSDTPLIYKAVRTWFVAVEQVKEQLIEANKKIHWVPSHIKEGRFGKWLENARDWAISRNRYWGTPIPIWRGDKGSLHVFASIAELEEAADCKIDDLHRQHIDSLTFEKNGETFTRIPEVFDCWFESGSMPYAQNHYPFENKELTEKQFPADFIAEGLDQTRGWFYTLNVLSVALFDKPAFKNVIVNGIVLAEDGNKMSKRLKNYPDPAEVLDQYGADALRLYLLNSPVVKAEDLRFSKKGLELVLRQFLIPFWNAFFFLSTYANIYQWKPEKMQKPVCDIDRWIVSKVNHLVTAVEEGMEAYDLSKAIEPLVGFIDDLTNWYIRRCRSRFWADEDTQDRRSAFSALYSVLVTLVKVAAPFVPFLCEAVYQELKTGDMPQSVHLCDYPAFEQALYDEDLEKEMDFVKKTVSLGHALRKEQKLKVRQPLQKVHVVASNEQLSGYYHKQKQLILDELNVKEMQIHSDEKEFMHVQVKPNFRILGKKIGQLMPKVKAEIEKFSSKEIEQLKKNQSVSITVDGQAIDIAQEDVQIERIVKENIAAAAENEIAIAYDTKLSKELLEEGISRELVNKINTMRREEGLEVQDRIEIKMETTDYVKSCFEKYKDYICKEVLALTVSFETCVGTSWDINGEDTTIAITKAL